MSGRRDLPQRIEKLIEVGLALSSETDTASLLEMILLGAKAITNADGGTLYSVHDDGTVRMEIIRTDSLDFAMGGTTGTSIPFSPIPLYDEGGEPNQNNVVTCAILDERTINIPDAYNADGFDFSGTRKFDELTGYRSTSFLTVPMKNHDGDIIGVLQLLNARETASDRIVPFDTEAQRLAEALASQAAIALTNRKLINDLNSLLESLIHLIANAIDEKSPYTGGHCRRVPVITMMLADAVANTREGPLKDFTLTEADRYELEVAAWLHDCGKIVTPEYVVDKSTKLESLFDRIHLVDARFEILRRDEEIRCLRRELAARDEDEIAAARDEHEAAVSQLESDRRFLHRCNQGSEYMAESDQAKVRAIAKQSWRDLRGRLQPLLSDDEVKNLNIAKGTLTDEERQIINGHINATINMLNSLRFPKHLKNVPEYAGGHHERVDGKGYPNGLTREQMSVQARIMAIADIFEALTAKDRPYKPGKKLSETLTILTSMKNKGHIDPDIFDVFVREKVYLQYAEAYLSADQQDEVDLDSPARTG